MGNDQYICAMLAFELTYFKGTGHVYTYPQGCIIGLDAAALL